MTLTAGVVSAISGCAGDSVPLVDAVKDKKSFLVENYSAKSINENVFKKLPLESDGQKSEFKVYFSSHVEGANGLKLDRKMSSTYTNLGNGLIQNIDEYSSNDIPNIYNFSISYRDLIEIKWQEAFPGEMYTRYPMEIKEITTWDKLDQDSTGSFKAAYKFGRVMQMGNYTDGEFSCLIEKQVDAQTIHAKLTGKARMLNCTSAENGLVSFKQKRVYVDNLKVALPLETISANSKENFTVLDITGI